MQNSRLLRAVSGVCLAALTVSVSAADQIENRQIRVIPAIPGESYLFDLATGDGFVTNAKTGEKLAAQSFLFDLMKQENIACKYLSDVDVMFVLDREDAARTKGPRPGWQRAVAYGGKGGTTVQSCGTFDQVKEPGKYEMTFSALKPDAAGKVRVFFYNPFEEPDIDMIRARVANAKLVKAADLADKPAVSRGRAIFAGDLPDGGRAWVDAKPKALRPFYSALLRDAEYNAVGNFSKLGVAAIASGEYDIAKWAFDAALARIEAIYANDEAAKAARSKFSQESIKDFKGDPYERAMVYYYRGLLYLREGDYGNARASFVSGEYQDTISESEEFQSDFALMNYLAGWSARCMGNERLAEDSFAVAAKIDAKLAAPGPRQSMLIVAETGVGPVKLLRGKSGQLVTLAPSIDYYPGIAKAPAFGATSLARAGDMTFQATTRGGRHFDAIMNGKVAYKESMGTVSDVAMGAAGLLADKVGGLGGMFSMVASLGAKSLSDATKTQADVRYWDTLPDAVFVGAAPLGVMSAMKLSDGASPTIMMRETGKQKCALLWSTDRSPVDAKAGVPGTPRNAPEWRAKKAEAAQRDKEFRTGLMNGTI